MAEPNGPEAIPPTRPPATSDPLPSVGPASTRPKVRHDRVTVTAFGTCIAWGFFLYAFSSATPLVAQDLHIDKAVAGLHGTALAVGAVIAALAMAPLVGRWGRRRVAVVGLTVAAVGMVGLASAPSIFLTLPLMTFTAMGGTIALPISFTILIAHHGPAGTAAITEGNASGSLVGILGPLTVAVAVAIGWGWRAAIIVAALLTSLVALATARLGDSPVLHGERPRLPATAPDGSARPPRTLPQLIGSVFGAPGRLLAKVRARPGRSVAAFAAFTGVATMGSMLEFATTFWAAQLLMARTGADASIAITCLAAFLVGLTSGRLLAAPLSLRHSPVVILALWIGVGIAGWACLWFSTSLVVMVIGLGILGFGIGPQYPFGIDFAVRHSPFSPDRSQSLLQICSNTGVGLAPFLSGWLGDLVGVHMAFLCVPVYAAIALAAIRAGTVAIRRRSAV
jgi:MFS family permease